MNGHDNIAEQAIAILARAPLIDGHNDWPYLIRGFYDGKIENKPAFDAAASQVGHVDIARMVKGRSGGVFWSTFLDCPLPENDFSDEIHFEVMRDTMQQIDLVHRLADKYDDVLEMVERADDIMRIFRQGKIACLIGVEGLHQICNSASILRLYHKLGVRYITLTHNASNLYAASSRAKNSPHDGLTAAGRDMVREMNRIGMMIDLSHTNNTTAEEVLKMSLAPVAFSHSCAYTLCQHVRNVPDSNLNLLKQNNGVIMVSFASIFVCNDKADATLAKVVDHIIYIADRIGYDHIGIGSDFDGTANIPVELKDVSKFPALVEEMLRRDISPSDIEKVLGLNVIRVLKDIEEVARQNKRKLPVLEDSVKRLEEYFGDEQRAQYIKNYPEATL